MTTKTILELLQTYHQDGFQVQIDGAVVKGWQQVGDNVIEILFDDDADHNIYMRANSQMVRESAYGKMFHYSNSPNMRFENWVAPVIVTQQINVQF